MQSRLTTQSSFLSIINARIAGLYYSALVKVVTLKQFLNSLAIRVKGIVKKIIGFIWVFGSSWGKLLLFPVACTQ